MIVTVSVPESYIDVPKPYWFLPSRIPLYRLNEFYQTELSSAAYLTSQGLKPDKPFYRTREIDLFRQNPEILFKRSLRI